MSPEQREEQKRADVGWVVSTEQGRRFIWELLAFCGVYRALEGEPNQMLVQEGTRRVGLHLLGITTEASEDLVFTMMQEAKNRSLEDKHERSKHDDIDTSPGSTSSGSDSEYDIATGGYDSGDALPEYDRTILGSFL